MNNMKTALLGATAMVALSTGAFAANTSTIEQAGTNQVADVTQTGVNNSFVTQDGDDNNARVKQDGTNLSNIYQGWVGSQSGFSNTADVDQKGNNKAYILQLNNSKNYNADVKQDGTGGYVHIQTEGGSLAKASQATINQYAAGSANAQIYQTGTGGNLAQIDQGVSGVPVTNVVARIDQSLSIDNIGKIVQTADDNKATLNQQGHYNEGYINQHGDNGSVTALQWNSTNTLNVDQLAGGGSVRMVVDSEQYGALNKATFEQSGSDNYAELLQIGIGNTSEIFQSGGVQSAKVTQLHTPAGGHFSTINQSGAGANSATVLQN